MLINTCRRLEVYFVVARDEKAVSAVTVRLSCCCNASMRSHQMALFSYAATHDVREVYSIQNDNRKKSIFLQPIINFPKETI